MLSQLIAILNNSIKYSFTRLVSTKILYRFKVKKLLNLLSINNLKLNNLRSSQETTELVLSSTLSISIIEQRIIAIRVSIKPSIYIIDIFSLN